MLTALTSRDPPRIGPYKLLGVLGAGGFGRVFLGESADGQFAAVKVIKAELAADRDFRVRFRREAAAARRVSGRFTARLIDADVDGPEPWLATEYVDGPSLAEAVALDGPLPADSVLVLAAGLAEALAAIHAASLVHRDLNPRNVLLADDGPRVIDFGIARADGASRLTSTGVVIGTFAFMSPEQARGRAVGPPSDVFSLGSVLVFAATGQGPFGAGADAELLYRVAHEMPDLDQVPAELRPLAARCLAGDPARRPAPGDLLAHLSHVRPAKGWLPGLKAMPSLSYQPLRARAQPAAGQGNSPQPAPRQPMSSGSARSQQSVLTLGYAARSDIGLVRERNEDSAYAGPHLLAVADGSGGHATGEVASSVAIASMAKLGSKTPGGDMLSELRSVVAEANARLGEMIATNPAVNGMSTTLTALFWSEGHAAVCHIGDSRGYLLREGKLYQFTHDHTLMQSLVDEGRISADDASAQSQRSLLQRALDGRSIAEPDLSEFEGQAGDRYLLCSDGLSDVVSDETLRETLTAVEAPAVVTRRLVELALQGGGPDNITCIVADVVETATTHMPTTRTPVVTGAASRNQKAWATVTPAQHFSELADPKPDSSPVTISATSLWPPTSPYIYDVPRGPEQITSTADRGSVISNIRALADRSRRTRARPTTGAKRGATIVAGLVLVTAALFVALVIALAVMSAVNRHHAAAAAMPAGPISPTVKLVCDPHVGGTWCEDGANGSAGTIALDIVGVSYDSIYNLCSMGYKFDLTDNYGQSSGVTGDGCGGYGDVYSTSANPVTGAPYIDLNLPKYPNTGDYRCGPWSLRLRIKDPSGRTIRTASYRTNLDNCPHNL